MFLHFNYNYNKLPILLNLLLLLLLSCSYQDTASAFAHRTHHCMTASTTAAAARRRRNIKEYDDGINIHLTSASARQLATMTTSTSLRVRGGGGRGGGRGGGSSVGSTFSTKLSSTAIKQGDDDDGDDDNDNHNCDKFHQAANQAIQSMQFCYKMCFLSVLADFATTLINRIMITLRSNTNNKFLVGILNNIINTASENWSWVDYVGAFSSLSPLVFGGGIWRIAQLYRKSYLRNVEKDFDRRMTRENLIALFRTKAWISGVVALNVALASVVLAVALPALGKENGPFSFLWNDDGVAVVKSPRKLTLAGIVLGVQGIGGVLVRRECRKTAMEEIRSYREKHGIRESRLNLRPDFDEMRTAGFRAHSNQALCAGSFGVMGCLQLVKWIASFDGDIIGHALLVYDFLTPFTLSLLLFHLNGAWVRACTAEVLGDRTRADHHDEIYFDLCVAGTEFYNKVAITLRSAAIFQLLPYFAIPISSFILTALKKISFFAKVIESYGIDTYTP